MLDLQTVELLLSISETELVEELLIGLLAAPQLVIFFEKFPAIKKALSKDLLVWKTKLGLKLQHAIVPTAISDEFSLYKQTLSLNSSLFFNQLPDIIQQLEYFNSPFTPQAKKLAATIDKASDSFQSLFIRKWRTSLSTQVTTLHQSLIQEDLDQLIVELQERLVINSALEPFLVENEQSAGQLWDMTRSEKYKSDSNTLIEYGKFLSQQPELLKLAQQLGR